MKIIEYNNALDIVIEFQDKYNAEVHTSYSHFLSGDVKNPYRPNVVGIGVIGTKYPSRINNKIIKEYASWNSMLERCYDTNRKERYLAYQDVTCCDEWLLYENFYEWLHSQSNFDKWLNGKRWAIDKDILIKSNKIYRPEACCLVPANVNGLFIKHEQSRGNLPIGVHKNGSGFMAVCMNPLINKREYLGTYKTSQEAFLSYKQYKENLIKQIAEIEYLNKNITKQCYESMISYNINIID